MISNHNSFGNWDYYDLTSSIFPAAHRLNVKMRLPNCAECASVCSNNFDDFCLARSTELELCDSSRQPFNYIPVDPVFGFKEEGFEGLCLFQEAVYLRVKPYSTLDKIEFSICRNSNHPKDLLGIIRPSGCGGDKILYFDNGFNLYSARKKGLTHCNEDSMVVDFDLSFGEKRKINNFTYSNLLNHESSLTTNSFNSYNCLPSPHVDPNGDKWYMYGYLYCCGESSDNRYSDFFANPNYFGLRSNIYISGGDYKNPGVDVFPVKFLCLMFTHLLNEAVSFSLVDLSNPIYNYPLDRHPKQLEYHHKNSKVNGWISLQDCNPMLKINPVNPDYVYCENLIGIPREHRDNFFTSDKRRYSICFS